MPHAQTYVLYNHDEHCLASTKIYTTVEDATPDADALNNVMILVLLVPFVDDNPE